MFAGFDPSQAEKPYFERHRAAALGAALFVQVAVAGVIVWVELNRSHEEIVDVLLDEPVVENLDIEEELEIEEEPEPEPEPEPQPKARSEIENVTKQTDKIRESDVAPEREPEPEIEPAPKGAPPPVVKDEPKAEPKPKKKSEGVGDPTVARPMPAEGTPPKPLKTNAAPAYPESLRKDNITGVVKVKLNIYMDGSVRGMKVLKKQVSGTDDPAVLEKAQKLFLKAVVAAVKTWKFEPAKLKGKPISVWWPVTIPFTLN